MEQIHPTRPYSVLIIILFFKFIWYMEQMQPSLLIIILYIKFICYTEQIQPALLIIILFFKFIWYMEQMQPVLLIIILFFKFIWYMEQMQPVQLIIILFFMFIKYIMKIINFLNSILSVWWRFNTEKSTLIVPGPGKKIFVKANPLISEFTNRSKDNFVVLTSFQIQVCVKSV